MPVYVADSRKNEDLLRIFHSKNLREAYGIGMSLLVGDYFLYKCRWMQASLFTSHVKGTEKRLNVWKIDKYCCLTNTFFQMLCRFCKVAVDFHFLLAHEGIGSNKDMDQIVSPKAWNANLI